MRNALSVVYALLLTGLTCSAQQRSVKANISVDPDDAGNPPGKYFNINKGNADRLYPPFFASFLGSWQDLLGFLNGRSGLAFAREGRGG